MSAKPRPRSRTRQEDLALERDSADRHEYVRGYVYPHGQGPYGHFAMAGARRRRVGLIPRFGGLLDTHLGDSPCKVYTVAMRRRVAAADADFYPDLFVARGGDPRANPLELDDARRIVEALSPGTEGYDLSDKFEAYRPLPNLREYVLLSPRRVAATIYHRTPDDRWEVEMIDAGGDRHLESIAYRIALSSLYAGIIVDGPVDAEHART